MPRRGITLARLLCVSARGGSACLANALAKLDSASSCGAISVLAALMALSETPAFVPIWWWAVVAVIWGPCAPRTGSHGVYVSRRIDLNA